MNKYLVAATTRVPRDVPTLARTNHAPLKFGQRLQGWSVSPRIVVPEDRAPQHEQVSQPWMTIAAGEPIVFRSSLSWNCRVRTGC